MLRALPIILRTVDAATESVPTPGSPELPSETKQVPCNGVVAAADVELVLACADAVAGICCILNALIDAPLLPLPLLLLVL